MTRRKHHRLRELLSAYIDGETSASETREVEAHLAQCEECSVELETLRATSGLLRQLPQLDIPRSFVLTETPAPVRSTPPLLWTARLATSVAAVLLVALLLGDVIGFITQVEMQPGRAAFEAPAAPAPQVLQESPSEPDAPAAPAPAPAAPRAAPSPPTPQPLAEALPAAPAPAPAAPAPPEPAPTVEPAPAMAAAAPEAETSDAAPATPEAMSALSASELGLSPSVSPTSTSTPTPSPSPRPTFTPVPTSTPSPQAVAKALPPTETPPQEPAVSEAPTGIRLPLRQMEIATAAILAVLILFMVWARRRTR